MTPEETGIEEVRELPGITKIALDRCFPGRPAGKVAILKKTFELNRFTLARPSTGMVNVMPQQYPQQY